ncbi:EAL domain-containing protein [uncultured Dechloromonas sp.]|uniref:GGDEF/EAL domain-containing response regulator n=1 Tax=uncultured Dechloromonas sp. TaxID=171719 RepID=UPI0025DAFCB6|nr:EAL domain-containing protein [uncultured Dechloromonas sp.]
MDDGSDDDLVFIEEERHPQGPSAQDSSWRVLIVDDDRDVHEATEFALSGVEILGRKLELIHAFSGKEAIALLEREQDVAVVLLDVVMESDDAGLKTVEAIRQELMLLNIRIILRTGQPGQAPEADTIARYDINDYKTKSELTHARLFTTLTSAIRSYSQLKCLDASRLGLEKIVSASNQFIAEKGLNAFADGVITQLASLIGIAPEGLVCATSSEGAGDPEQYRVIAAAGRYQHLIQHRLEEIDNVHIARSLNQVLRNHYSVVGSRDITLFFRKNSTEGFAAYIESAAPIRDVDQHLLEIFCTNIALCAKNIDLVTELRLDALVDRQVGLPNRNALIAELDRRAHDGATSNVVALVDIDQFAATNDMLGHAYGDALLRAMAQRLRALFDSSVFVARLAGDAFALTGPAHLLEADSIQRLFAHPFLIDDIDHAVSVCLGIAACADSADSQDTLNNAYVALRRAKALGIGQSITFSPEIGEAARQRTSLLRDLRQAFEQRELSIVYQPQIDLQTGRIIGAEALMRWQRRNGQFVPPEQFIPIAEQSGLIVSIGRWMLPEALRTLKRFHQAGLDGLHMAVNVSSIQLRQPGFLDFVNASLAETDVAPNHLELEITESIALESLETMIALLNQLRSRGITIAIDDFGTGYSSLNYLEQLPIDHLKIDRSFVTSLASSERGSRIVRTIALLGNELDVRTVAEGVENQSTGDRLREFGCHAAQGYHYAHPMDETSFLDWMKEHA